MTKKSEDKEKEKSTKKETTKTHKRRSYKKELEKALEENRVLKEQLLRVAAEFDNYKKRSEREKSNVAVTANIEFIKNILPIVDDLERSLEASEKNKDFETLLKGIELVHKNFLKILENLGVKPIKSVGEKFDPEKHDALMQMEVKGQKPDIVVDEHLKGYEFKDRVIRHAKVIVSK